MMFVLEIDMDCLYHINYILFLNYYRIIVHAVIVHVVTNAFKIIPLEIKLDRIC